MTHAEQTMNPIDKAAALPDGARPLLRSLILTLADTKRVLGIRYSDWMLGAPTLETGIAASSMAQDEWGHSRLTYALLSEFGDEPKRLEHERSAEQYHSMAALDSPFGSWSEMIAAALLVDGALTLQYAALADSRYTPLHNRVQKLLDEEEFHFQYAAGWAPRITANPEPRAQLAKAVRHFLPAALTWFGRDDDEGVRLLREEGLVHSGPEELRKRFLMRVAPVLEACGVAEQVGLTREGDAWRFDGDLRWDGWDAGRRRVGSGGPDADTLARVRGDKNRSMLLE
jgi:ring-1,2-phenylacetyl-CoA epoxidase subunit PaaC